LNKQKTIDFGIQKITSFKLKKSELRSTGPIYSDLEEIQARKWSKLLVKCLKM